MDGPRVGINAHLLNLTGTYRSAGISSYIHQLLGRLPAAAPDLTLHGFTGEARSPSILPGIAWHVSRLPTQSPLVRIFWEQAVHPWQVFRHGLRLLHSLGFAVSLGAGVPSVVTVHDLSFLFFPELFGPLQRRYLRWGTRVSVRRARRVIAVSEHTKRDLVRALGVTPEKIEVVHHGVDERFFAGDSPAARGRPRGPLPERFVLYVGTLEPRKNVPRLVRAFARAKQAAHLPHRLVIVGAPGWLDQEIGRAVEETGLQDHVVFTGYVAAEQLPEIYRAAEAFVYPSLYEGFGLPPLEALASGVPVIVSNAASLPEVVGDAGVYVEPHDERALAEAIASLLGDRRQRDELRTRGLARARQFSWTRAAEATAAVYREVLAGS